MKYVAIATVRAENTPTTWTEIFIGEPGPDQKPDSVAYLGVSDLNASKRHDARKTEMVSVVCIPVEQAGWLVEMITVKLVKELKDVAGLRSFEDSLDISSSFVCAKIILKDDRPKPVLADEAEEPFESPEETEAYLNDEEAVKSEAQ